MKLTAVLSYSVAAIVFQLVPKFSYEVEDLPSRPEKTLIALMTRKASEGSRKHIRSTSTTISVLSDTSPVHSSPY